MSLEDAYRFFQHNQLADARRSAAKLVRKGQQLGAAHQLLGYIEGREGRFLQSAQQLTLALQHAPGAVESWYYLGMAQARQARHAEAAQALRKAVALAPDFFEAWHDLGLALHALQRHAEAAPCFERALALRGDSVPALLNAGITFGALRRPAEELACYERAHALDGSDTRVLEYLGVALLERGRNEEALAALRQLRTLQPAHAGTLGALLQAQLKLGDWAGLESLLTELRTRLAAGEDCVAPFALTTLPSTPAEQRAVAQRFARQFEGVAPAPRAAAPGTRLRIGYLSSDFRVHPVAFAMARLYELHDRTRFEAIALSTGADDGSAIRARLSAGFERFIDLQSLDDAALAGRIAAVGIDILVDLNGCTEGGRPGVLARRPAPLQMAYLGFPGTAGAPFVDYLVADRWLVPESERAHYAEQVLYLPDSYQANDDRRARPAATPARAALGLPKQSFVFCCFNDGGKIQPPTFEVWMRLLAQRPGSVLWLAGKSAVQQANLRGEAARRGVDGARLVFAPYVDIDTHLQRLPAADLFLDTWPYNAHGTASDALWAGLPLLSCRGATFAGRVGSSLLHAVGLPELVTESPEAYEALALQLSAEPARLLALRRRLQTEGRGSALFDSARFTRHLEAGYEMAWQRHRAGLAPAALVVPASTPLG